MYLQTVVVAELNVEFLNGYESWLKSYFINSFWVYQMIHNFRIDVTIQMSLLYRFVNEFILSSFNSDFDKIITLYAKAALFYAEHDKEIHTTFTWPML